LEKVEEREQVRDDGTNELGRRLAAAYVSYLVGHVGVDRMLKQVPEKPGRFWREMAELLFRIMQESEGIGADSDLRLREAITKYIQ